MKNLTIAAACLAALSSSLAFAAPPEPITDVELQPLAAQVKRVEQALTFVGSPFSADKTAALAKAYEAAKPAEGVEAIQAALDPLCLAIVSINAEGRVTAAAGEAPKKLIQQGWSTALIKVVNLAGVTADLRCLSPNAAPLHKRSTSSPEPPQSIKPSDVGDRWLDIALFEKQPLNKALSGLKVEYRILELYSRDAGKREAKLQFDVGQGSQDLGFRNEVNILFECAPAVEVVLDILDDDGSPTTGQFVFRDGQNRVYPLRTRRMAPDFFFHDQIYRHHGESVTLPPGKYTVEYTRGPEYRVLKREITVPHSASTRESFRLKRWIKLAGFGWYSGDHHVHAAGCSHYEAPTEGVEPQDMMRHILGEDLNVGCVLSWGPCWYFQKQFFDGQVHKLSTPRHLMRYDVEVSGFPSSHAGHLCLLRLKEDDFPGTTRIEQWPSWNQPILKWGQEQGGIVGYSHSGWGLKVDDKTLPSYSMPKFDGIGANEYVVNVVHDACDFISAVDTPIIWELSVWYHTLNCGYQCRISGETDFPCIYGDRVGLGRAYVQLDRDGPLDYDEWARGIKDGKSYCCDGKAHLFDMKVNGLGVGRRQTKDSKPSVLQAKAGEKLAITVQAAALLEDQPRDDIRNLALDVKPYWHVERARIGATNKIPVELIVNGQVVETRELTADGAVSEIKFDYTPKQSSWIALRSFPCVHTNPVFVEVDGQPIRASKRSAQWCLDAVDVCWNAKVKAIREGEKEAAQAAYDGAREAYKKILAESKVD